MTKLIHQNKRITITHTTKWGTDNRKKELILLPDRWSPTSTFTNNMPRALWGNGRVMAGAINSVICSTIATTHNSSQNAKPTKQSNKKKTIKKRGITSTYRRWNRWIWERRGGRRERRSRISGRPASYLRRRRDFGGAQQRIWGKTMGDQFSPPAWLYQELEKAHSLLPRPIFLWAIIWRWPIFFTPGPFFDGLTIFIIIWR